MPGLVWGECELQPFCFGLQRLVMAARMPEAVSLEAVLARIEGVDGVSSCEVRSCARVTCPVAGPGAAEPPPAP